MPGVNSLANFDVLNPASWYEFVSKNGIWAFLFAVAVVLLGSVIRGAFRLDREFKALEKQLADKETQLAKREKENEELKGECTRWQHELFRYIQAANDMRTIAQTAVLVAKTATETLPNTPDRIG